MKVFLKTCLFLVMLLASCQKEDIAPSTIEETLPMEPNANATPRGMYLLCEGNMGSNKASLDYVDFRKATYLHNIYSERNPHVVRELGDVGNDIAIYGSKLYAVINCSHKVEIMQASTAKRLGQVDIPNPRNVIFYKGYAYVSSFVSEVKLDQNAPLGAVYQVDTTNYNIINTVLVGYQPEEMAIVDNYLLVANSGGYIGATGGNYDNTLSVVDLNTFTEVKKIPVGLNLHRVKVDSHGNVWLSSRGNYSNIPANLFCIENIMQEMQHIDTLNIACSNFCLTPDMMYFYSTAFNYTTGTTAIAYGTLNLHTKTQGSMSFITDGSEQDIAMPYAITTNPTTGDIYIADAKNHVSSGELFCFSSSGKKKWNVRTGDIPAHLVMVE